MTQADTLKEKKAFLKSSIRKEFSNWLFLSPFIVGFCLLVLYPCAMSLIYSFTDFNGVFMTGFGLFNYASLFDFSQYGIGKEVFRSLGLTVIYTVVSIPINVLLSFILSLLLRKAIPGIKVLRLLFYLPVLIPGIVFGQIWLDMLAYPTGLINQWLAAVGLPKGTFLSSAKTQLGTLIGLSQWTMGGSMIIWLAALSNISPTIYEAAEIDGAKFFTKLFKITIPLCTPMIFFNIISLVIMCLQTFDSYAYLNRGIGEATYFIAIRIYYTAFEQQQYGFACSIAWLLFVIIAALTAIMFKTSKWVYYGD